MYDLSHTERAFGRINRLTDDLLVFLLRIRLERLYPFRMLGLVNPLGHLSQCAFTVAQHSQSGLHVLVNLTWVYVEMDYLRLLGISVDVACYTVVETHTDSNEKVTLVGLDVRSEITVHTQHSHIQRMVRRQVGQPEESTTDRYVRFLYKVKEFRMSVAQFHSLSRKQQWLVGMVDEVRRLFYGIVVHRRHRLVTAYEMILVRLIVHHSCLCVLGEVEYHRSRSSAAGDIERAAHRPSDVLGTANLVTPLGDRVGHIHHVHLLKRVSTQH